MYKKILFSVDLNDAASWERALPTALEHCQAFSAELHVLTIVPDLPMGVINLYVTSDVGAQLISAAREGLTKFIDEKIPAGFKVFPHIGNGSIYIGIIETAEKVGADLIVMASHRPDMSDYLLGPNAARVVRHAPQSVLVVRG
jgi:nucleotide-binding universal stress UspA family protein